jgi:hypothetical protein
VRIGGDEFSARPGFRKHSTPRQIVKVRATLPPHRVGQRRGDGKSDGRDLRGGFGWHKPRYLRGRKVRLESSAWLAVQCRRAPSKCRDRRRTDGATGPQKLLRCWHHGRIPDEHLRSNHNVLRHRGLEVFAERLAVEDTACEWREPALRGALCTGVRGETPPRRLPCLRPARCRIEGTATT